MKIRIGQDGKMKNEYDLTKMEFKKNPYAKKLKEQITIRLDPEVISYFKAIAEKNELSYQALINLYLKDCVKLRKKPVTKWLKAS